MSVPSGRRLSTLLLVLALVGAPAVALRAACVGNSCDDETTASVRVPFCPLPAALRGLIAAGFRDGRSPDVMGATDPGGELTATVDGTSVAWPSTGGAPDTTVPILFFGTGVTPGAVPAGTGLDQIAPTIETILGLHRPHPEVRAGTAVAGVASGARPRLVVEIGLEGVGAAELAATPRAWRILRDRATGGAATWRGTTGSVPLDPIATLTTIGTGALPSQHGITGAVIRRDDGRVVRAWTKAAPPSVVSTLPDDLDHLLGGRPRIALVADDVSDRGLVGGTWYLSATPDDIRLGKDPVETVRSLVEAGYGADDTPDVIGVVLHGSLGPMTHAVGAIASAVRRAGVPTTFVVAGTGSTSAADIGIDVAGAIDTLATGRPLVASTVAGGVFLDRTVMDGTEVTSDDVVRVMRGLRAPDGEPLFADAFPAFAVSFSRYC